MAATADPPSRARTRPDRWVCATCLAALWAGTACGSERAVDPPASGTPSEGRVPAVDPEPEVDPESERTPYAYSASRCGECHASAYAQWVSSDHAGAATTPTFVAMRAAVPDASGCDTCHSPLASWLEPGDPIGAEGVSCDGCHAVGAVEVSTAGAVLDVRLADNVKYGPLCDAEDHYFHRMGCSPLHESAELCAGCHHLVRTVGTETFPVYSEYSEWLAGPYPAEGIQCVSCHMPGSPGAAATGSAVRDALSHHGFFGRAGDLRARAVELTVDVTATDDDTISVLATVRNRRAGHRIPSGSPSRRIVVRAIARDAEGHEARRAERELGRILVDADGREAPHHTAVRLASDDRIGPRESREVVLDLDAPDRGTIEVEVVWLEMSEELAARLGVTERIEIPLARASATLGPASRRRRIGRAAVEHLRSPEAAP